LLIHLGLGCCLHHAHACDARCCESPAPAADTCCCQGHRHDSQPVQPAKDPQAPRPTSPHEDRPQHRCDGSRCTVVRSEQSPEQRREVRCDVCLLEADVTRGCDFMPLCMAGKCENPRYQDTGPLRVHLLFSVLLI
jgi:hypothetical protein